MAISTTRISEGERLPAEINVTPLIDVLLVLLIIFMVIAPVAPRGLNASVPSTTSTGRTDEDADRPILVQMEQGEMMVRYSVDGTPVVASEVKVAGTVIQTISEAGAPAGRCQDGLWSCCSHDRHKSGRRG
ncbi:MAG: biopolymer transporter ExbD [Edaphobacter sp.]